MEGSGRRKTALTSSPGKHILMFCVGTKAHNLCVMGIHQSAHFREWIRLSAHFFHGGIHQSGSRLFNGWIRPLCSGCELTGTRRCVVTKPYFSVWRGSTNRFTCFTTRLANQLTCLALGSTNQAHYCFTMGSTNLPSEYELILWCVGTKPSISVYGDPSAHLFHEWTFLPLSSFVSRWDPPIKLTVSRWDPPISFLTSPRHPPTKYSFREEIHQQSAHVYRDEFRRSVHSCVATGWKSTAVSCS